jgi:hypothetical protein
LANGSAGAPSLNFLGDTTTGLFLAGTGSLGFALNGANGMNLNANGLFVPEGIPGGSF